MEQVVCLGQLSLVIMEMQFSFLDMVILYKVTLKLCISCAQKS